MHIITKEVPSILGNTPISGYLLNKDFMIFDIETTGFSKDYAILYMIGCIYSKNGHYEYCNIFAESPSEESEVIQYFLTMLKDFTCVIHFNGNGFDIPFLLSRAKRYSIADTISHLESIDIYDLLRPYRKCLDFPNLKLDTIQTHLGYNRKDTTTGGELIPIYQSYAKEPYLPYYELLLLHNKEDVEGMISLLPLIDIFILIDQLILGKDFEYASSHEEDGETQIVYSLPYKAGMDLKLSCQSAHLRFSSGSDLAKLTLPIYEGKLKLFFDNYKDYMYLPEKDDVIHKSIASFMYGHKKVQAKKSNCYVSHTGRFLSVFKLAHVHQPFRKDFRSKDYYVSLDTELNHAFFISQLPGFLETCNRL